MNATDNYLPAIPTPARREHPQHDNDHLTYQAAALYIAGKVYTEALSTPNPASTLDDVCDALPEVMPEVFQKTGTAPALATVLLPEVANLLWAYTAIEYARAEAGDGYGYLFDWLGGTLRDGADPHTVRKAALDAPKRLRALGGQTGGAQ